MRAARVTASGVIASAVLLASAVVASSLAWAPRALAQDVEVIDYSVRDGDTCGSIARRLYGNSRRYDLIHEHNPELGPMPHRLSPGSVLHLPQVEVSSNGDATVTAARRQVQSQRPQVAEWDRAPIGQELYQGWRVSTGESSSAELTFRSSSVASIREETLVIIYGGEARRVRREGAHAVIRSGAMLSRLSGLSGGDEPLEVETPTAVAILSSGEAGVSVDRDGTTRVSTHAGTPARVRTRGRARSEISVPAGMATRVNEGRAPTPPRPLPHAPAWVADQPSRFLGLTDRGGSLRGSWQPVADARSYRVEIARRPDGRDLMVAIEAPATITSFEAHRLPPGTYYVRVSTIDGELFEGRPEEPATVELVGVTIVEPGADPPAPIDPQLAMLRDLDGYGDVDFEADVPPRAPVLLGSSLLAPEGVTCAVGASAPSHDLRFAEEGDQHLTCVNAEGQNIVGIDVTVQAIQAEVFGEDGAAAVLVRGRVTPVRMAVHAGAASPADLTVVGGAGLTVESLEPIEGGGFRSMVRADADAPDVTDLRVVRGSRTDTVLATAAVRTVEPPAEPIDETPVETIVASPEALGLAAYPSWVGLRDERRHGSGIWTSLSIDSARLGEPDVRVRAAAGVRASFFEEHLRVDAQVPLDIVGIATRSADRGSRDVFASLSSLLLDGEGGVGLAIDAGLWAPTSGAQGLDRGRLQVAADFSLRSGDGLTLRTRQAGIFDLVADGSTLWASAYGFDLAVLRPLVIGAEGTMVIGYEDGRDWYAGGIALSLALDLSPVVISTAIRYGFGDDLFPVATFVLNVRGSFEQ